MIARLLAHFGRQLFDDVRFAPEPRTPYMLDFDPIST